MKQLTRIILIVISLTLGYMGVRKICNSGGVINVVGIELSEYNESAKTSGFVLVGLAVIGLIAGVSLIGKKI